MGRPAPAEVRATLRAAQHPATAVPCSHCGARAHLPCRLRHTGRQLPVPHDSRVLDAALVARTVCPTCQVTTGTPCRTQYDQPYPGIHPSRRTP
jgi:RNase P subunit RPR2